MDYSNESIYSENNFSKRKNSQSLSISMDHITSIPYASKLIAEIAPEIGATVWLEPDYWFVGEIRFSNGKKHLFRNTNFNVNPLWSIEIVKDKWYCSQFLRRYGYQVAESKTFFRDDLNRHLSIQRNIEDGWKYAKSLWLPVILKPNNLSKGAWVQRVDSEKEYFIAARAIQELSRVMLIEKMHAGQDYRVVVFQDEVISAYTRIPLEIIGDGVLSIEELLQRKQVYFIQTGRDTRINTSDPRIQRKLEKQGLWIQSIPSKWRTISLLDNANLSCWGESIDVSNVIHPDFVELAVKITKDMGLKLCWVDFMTKDISKPLSENSDYIIIELNGAPWLDNYLCSWAEQETIVRSLYKKILLELEKMI
jgi:D-alanine-D-alanine ligase-like ATP-grasp enzyme